MSLLRSGPEIGRIKMRADFFLISVRMLVPAKCLKSFAKLASVNTIKNIYAFLYRGVIVFFTMKASSKALKAS